MARLFFKLIGCGLLFVLLLGFAGSTYGQCPSTVSLSHVDISCFGFNDGKITVELSTDVNNFELWDNLIGGYVTPNVKETQTPNSVTYDSLYSSSFQVIAFKTGCPVFSISDGVSGFVIDEPALLEVEIG